MTNPAITFDDEELDAVIAGLAMLDRYPDEEDDLANAARAALARIEAALPDERAQSAPKTRLGDGPHHDAIRNAIHTETKLRLRYVDRKGNASERTIWPLEIDVAGLGETVGAWCEARQDFRHFRLDRIVDTAATGERIPTRRRILMARFRASEMDQPF